MRSFLVSVFLIAFGVACVNCKPWKSKLDMSVKFKVCDESASYLAEVGTVTVEPCDKQPCTLRKGKNSTITISFTENKGVPAVNDTKAIVHGIVAGIPFPFTIDNDDGCKSGVKCPVKPGDSEVYKFTLPISSVYPSVDCVVKWELKQTSKDRKKDGKEVFCIEIPVAVK
ncbi:NPC intracellular cholesterol transporter 2-like [Amphiura filiformis]|uniref:NPC intracellular cholesterol transporter 2-like n=1 Tax=Amphiura filiformis TaxID=82378 RepID=UPI003B219D27